MLNQVFKSNSVYRFFSLLLSRKLLIQLKENHDPFVWTLYLCTLHMSPILEEAANIRIIVIFNCARQTTCGKYPIYMLSMIILFIRGTLYWQLLPIVFYYNIHFA